MKKLKYLLITILFAAFAGDGFGQGDFIKNYTTPNISTSPDAGDYSSAGLMKISLSNYQGYVTVYRKSNTTVSPVTHQIILTKTDLFGNVNWSKVMDASSSPNITFDADDATGDVFLAFYKNSKLNIIKFDKNGSLLFSKQYGNSKPTKTKIVTISGNKYVITSSINNNNIPVLTTINTTGAFYYNKLYPFVTATKSLTFVVEASGEITLFSCFAGTASPTTSPPPPTYYYAKIGTLIIDAITGNFPNSNTSSNWITSEFTQGNNQSNNITDIVVTDALVLSSSSKFILSGYVEQYGKKAFVMAFDNNRNYKWTETFNNFSSINAMINTSKTINASGMGINEKASSLRFKIGANGSYSFTSSYLEVPNNSTNLWMSIPYSFDYGSNGAPVFSTEAGYLNLYPFFSLNSNNNSSCPLNTSGANKKNMAFVGSSNLQVSLSTSNNWSNSSVLLHNTVAQLSSLCGANCSFTYSGNIQQLGSVCSTGGGSATLAAVINGGGPYNYYWSDGSSGTMAITSPGTYSVTVSDPVTGCANIFTTTVTGDADLSTGSHAIDPATSSTCVNNPTTFNLVPNLNEPNASYSWTSAGGNSTNASLVAAFPGFAAYQVNLTYTNSCGSLALPPANVNVFGFIVIPSVTQPQCFGNLGSISLNVQPPPGATITYAWSNGATTSSISNLTAGIYSVVVTDGSCSQPFTFTINAAPSQLVLGSPSITDETCINANDGQISISATGGTSPYTYNWSDGSTGATNTGMASGAHSVTVTDANGCTDIASGLQVGQGQTGVSLGTPQFTNNSCFGVCDGEVTSISAAINSPSSTYTYAWSDGVNGTSSNPILTRNNLCANNYTVTVTEVNGCSSSASVSIIDGTSLWHKTTQNTTGQNDNIKRILTDADGNVYALGEYVEETVIDGEVLNAGGGSGQDGIFLAKYNNCGKLLWYVNSNSGGFSYDLKATDIVFSGSNNIHIYGKWNGGSNFVEMQNSVGGNAVSIGGSTTEQVFSFSIDKGSAAIFQFPNIYEIYFSDEVTKVLNDGTNSFFAGQFNVSSSITAGIRNGTGGALSWVFKDDLNGTNNIVTGMDMDANGNTYAIANLQSDADFNSNGLISVSSGQKEGAILKYDGSTVIKNIAKSPLINLTDVVYNSATQNVWVTGQFEDNIQNWNPNMVSGIQTGLIASFEGATLATVNQYYLDPSTGISVSSANAISFNGNEIFVAGTFTGHNIIVGEFSNPQANSSYQGSGNTNDLWMAKYDINVGGFIWIEGSNSPDPVSVNDIAFDGNNAYIGGGYSMDLYLPNLPRLHPTGAGNLGFIVRGGDFSTGGGQGEFYKTNNTNTSETTDVFENKTNIVVYPNPNNGTFTLRLVGEYTGETQLTIFDVTGRVVYQQTAQKASETTEFSLSPQGLSKGIYMIAVEQNGLTEYQKFMIQ